MSITILSHAVPQAHVDDLIRRLYLYLREQGVSNTEWDAWQSVACPFPGLRFEQAVAAITDDVLCALKLTEATAGVLCEPQFIFAFPSLESGPLGIYYHLDEEPPWSAGRYYSRIVGVALTEWTAHSGTLHIDTERGPEPVELQPGDIVIMSPDTLHMSGRNASAHPRIGLYLRWLNP